ncbi:uncharacterized protein LOC108673752 [Hyalella azteca]|uniref:Uncharacterized protein LOC108673752 n=1 Tax=Hyalella azteca TaxID=294128 RepID=A0A8B7NTR2_HYAAZ|nr:uncharacterized protein LOC108673752 [Hyalella azteca]
MASQACDDYIEQSLLTTDEQGYTALHHAVMASDLATLKKLLTYADERCVNMESHDRSTALLLLCKRFTPESQTDLQTEEEILVCLLAAGANPNLPQPDPVSLPLFAALERRWWRGAELLLDAGADAKATDAEHNNRSATFFAKDNVEILARLLKGGCSYEEISDWIGGGEFTKTQVKKMVLAVHELGPEFVTGNLLYETSIYKQDHESSYYLLNNFVILELDLPRFFNRIFYNGGIKDWNCKMKYIDVLTNYIFRNEEKKRELLFDLFLSCFQYCAVGGSQCAGQCGWNGSPQVQTSSEIQ